VLVVSARRDSRLIQGTVDLLILKGLTRGPQHGYAVSAWIRERTNGELGLDDAALYQALHRLEHRRLIESQWGLSDNNRRAKYYEITRDGRRRLAQDSSAWRRYARAVSAVLDPT
jgi:transcriptional regulator